jgi:hypothetical protein
MGMTLREGDREYYYKMLDRHFPGLRGKYERKYGNSYVISSDNDRELMAIFLETCKKANIVCNNEEIFKYMSSLDNQNRTAQAELDLF